MSDPRFRLSLARRIGPTVAFLLAFGVLAYGAKVLGDELAGRMPTRAEALPGRTTPIPTASHHAVFGTPLAGPFAPGTLRAMFAMGCFWGAEKNFWQVSGVVSTAVGYAGGFTPNPTYEETCTGRTGHAETVRVVFDPRRVSYAQLLRTFWENHDPTQGMRQGGDAGSQYRSAIFTFSPEQRRLALASRDAYQHALSAGGYGHITTEIREAAPFYFAEDYHQQYLAKNPGGYCPRHGTGVSCPIGLDPTSGETPGGLP